MKNRIVGILIIGIAALMGLITYLFNMALTEIVSTSCAHGTECPMWGTIGVQTKVSVIMTLFVVLIGIYLIFFGKEERIITKIKTVKQKVELKKITKEDYQKIMETLSPEEKLILEKVIESDGTIFQSDLVEKTHFTKVKITRLVDKLEGRGLVERRRRGMTNVVVLKHKS